LSAKHNHGASEAKNSFRALKTYNFINSKPISK
jgi:hypothetical protein